jgi:HK97 family phage portal protein
MPRKARGQPRQINPTPASTEYSIAFVRPQDTSGARFTVAGRADLLLPKINQWVEIASHDNATSCTSNILRLYKKKGGKRGGKRWATREINAKTNRDRWRYLTGQAIDTPGAKSVLWATQGDDIEEIINGELVAFLRRPNPWMSGQDWTYLRFKSKEDVGNAYTWFYTEGSTVEAYFLPPQGVRLVAGANEPISVYRYSRLGDAYLEMAANQVLHGKLRPSMQDWRIGESWTYALIQAMDILQAATDSQLAFYLNGSRPDILFTLPANTPVDKQKEIKDRIRNEHRGPQKAGGIMVASAGTTVTPIGYAPKDRAFMDEMDYYRRMIDNAAGRPESRSKMNDANRASADAGATQYARTTLLPRLIRDAEELTEFVLPLFGLTPGDYWFAYDNPVPEDAEARTNRVKALTAGGLMTINEGRSLEGLEAVDPALGDVLRWSGQPLVTQQTAQENREAARDAMRDRPKPGDRDEDEEDDQADDRPDEQDDREDEAKKRATKAVAAHQHKAGCGCDVKEYEGADMPPEFDGVLDGLENDIAAWIRGSANDATIAEDGSVRIDDAPLVEALDRYIIAAVGVSLYGIIFGEKVGYAKRDAEACAAEIEEAVATYRASGKTDSDKAVMRVAVAKAIRANVERGNVGNVIAALDGDAKELAKAVAEDVYGWAETDGGKASEVVKASYGKLITLAAIAALIRQQAQRARGLGGAAATYARRVARGMAQTQRALVTAATVAAQAGGVSLDAALVSARSSVAETATYRSVATARTETAAADNYANIWAYSAGGRIEAVEWVLSAVPCQTCIALAIDTGTANGSMDPVQAESFRAQLAAIGPGYNDNTKPQLAALGAAVMASGATFSVPLGTAFGRVGSTFDTIAVDEDDAARHMAWLVAAGRIDGRQAVVFEVGIHAPPLHVNCNCSIRPIFKA